MTDYLVYLVPHIDATFFGTTFIEVFIIIWQSFL